MREIGRLREISFRAAGGGTGKECDIDEFDTMEPPCRQLLVWDPDSRQILGGYRYITGKEIAMLPDGTPRIATSHMFRFSERFLRDYLPLHHRAWPLVGQTRIPVVEGRFKSPLCSSTTYGTDSERSP